MLAERAGVSAAWCDGGLHVSGTSFERGNLIDLGRGRT